MLNGFNERNVWETGNIKQNITPTPPQVIDTYTKCPLSYGQAQSFTLEFVGHIELLHIVLLGVELAKKTRLPKPNSDPGKIERVIHSFFCIFAHGGPLFLRTSCVAELFLHEAPGAYGESGHSTIAPYYIVPIHDSGSAVKTPDATPWLGIFHSKHKATFHQEINCARNSRSSIERMPTLPIVCWVCTHNDLLLDLPAWSLGQPTTPRKDRSVSSANTEEMLGDGCCLHTGNSRFIC